MNYASPVDPIDGIVNSALAAVIFKSPVFIDACQPQPHPVQNPFAAFSDLLQPVFEFLDRNQGHVIAGFGVLQVTFAAIILLQDSISWPLKATSALPVLLAGAACILRGELPESRAARALDEVLGRATTALNDVLERTPIKQLKERLVSLLNGEERDAENLSAATYNPLSGVVSHLVEYATASERGDNQVTPEMAVALLEEIGGLTDDQRTNTIIALGNEYRIPNGGMLPFPENARDPLTLLTAVAEVIADQGRGQTR